MPDSDQSTMLRAHETHESRISRLETSVATLAEGMSHLQEGQREQRLEMRDGFEELKNLDRNRSEQNQWTIGKVSSVVGITLLIGTSFLSPYFFFIRDQGQDIKELKNHQAADSVSRWSRSDAEREIDRVAVERDHDRRELVDSIKAHRDYVDMRDQRVMDNAQRGISAIAEDLKLITEWIGNHDRLQSGMDATQNTKIDLLMELFGRVNQLEVNSSMYHPESK